MKTRSAERKKGLHDLGKKTKAEHAELSFMHSKKSLYRFFEIRMSSIVATKKLCKKYNIKNDKINLFGLKVTNWLIQQKSSADFITYADRRFDSVISQAVYSADEQKKRYLDEMKSKMGLKDKSYDEVLQTIVDSEAEALDADLDYINENNDNEEEFDEEIENTETIEKEIEL